jgi:hypothetical protein
MDSIGKSLAFIKDVVVFVVQEMKQLDRMNQFISTNILTYEVAIANLLETITRLNCPLHSDVISQSTLSSILSLINAHVLSLQKLVITMTKWNNHVKAGGFKKLRAIVRERPSVLADLLFSKLLEIKPLLFEVSSVERDTLGSGVRIKNPLLRASWVLSGRNQINDSSIHKNIIAENIYVLLKRELGGELKKPENWKRAIQKFVNQLDGCAAGLPDDHISISEMNEYVVPAEKTTFRLLLKDFFEGSESVSVSAETVEEVVVEVEKEETIDIPITIDATRIDSKHKVEIPSCEGYGSNWPSVFLGKFTVPSPTVNELEFDFVEIVTKASDQGWGGTGHDNVRFQINDKPVEVGFFIDRNKSPDGTYKFLINYEKIQVGDEVKMWLSCAPWGGWSAQVHSMQVQATYDQ